MVSSKTVGSEQIQVAIERLATVIPGRHRGTKNLLLLGIANGEILRKAAG